MSLVPDPAIGLSVSVSEDTEIGIRNERGREISVQRREREGEEGREKCVCLRVEVGLILVPKK